MDHAVGPSLSTALPRPTETTEIEPRGDEFLDRDLSWLAFNRRVLHEAEDERTPLLERVRFLGICTSNLDEFFMKQVGRLKRHLAEGSPVRPLDDLAPHKELAAIRTAVLPLLAQQAQCYLQSILPALARHGVLLLNWEQLGDPDRRAACDFFQSHVFPVLTPLAVDLAHPFPFISNLSTSLGILLRHPERGETSFNRLKVPNTLPQWVLLNHSEGGQEHRFVSLVEIIRHNIGALFPDMEVLHVMPFRLTRSMEVELDDLDVDDLKEMVEEELRQRRMAQVVRLDHGPEPHPEILQLLMQETGIKPEDVYELAAELDYTTLAPVAGLKLPELRYPPWPPAAPPALEEPEADIFRVIRSGDVLVHHPYESFAASVERFVQAAAEDPKVLAIKMTLYRTSEESPFIPMLIHAANAGKQVACVVELKARLDEQRNLYWAEMLERAGVHVVYGIVELKTHTKTTLIVRQEPEGLRSYAHIGTGNYNTVTARLYTDLGLFTCRPDLTRDLAELFNYLTGRSRQREYRKLLVAPINLRERCLELIEREIAHRAAGRPAAIVAKMNSLEDRKIIRRLYRASQAGVPVELFVRGFCCLRPGVPGLSENIRVVSVVGRFLEHSRIFHFRNGAENPVDGEFYIGSADWMVRNLDWRVEAVAPIEERALRQRCWEILEIMRQDQRQAWDLKPDGTYVQRTPPPGATGPAALGTQQALMNLATRR